MSDRIVYRREKGRQLSSAEVDGNFQYLDERIDKIAQKDYFIYDAGYSLSNSNVVINPRSKWLIGGLELENIVEFTFNIPRADWTKYRVDVVVANASGSLELITGIESSEGYVVPRIVGNFLPYLYLYVSDAGLQNVGSEAVGDFISKLSYRWIQVDHHDKLLAVDVNERNINIIGGNSFIDGIMNGVFGIAIDENYPDGFEVSIRNKRTHYLTIIHDALEVNFPIQLYTQKDYFLRPNETIVLKYVKSEQCFVVSGGLDIQLTYQNVDDILGTDSLHLFIDSSEGETIAADNLQTTLTATVERYFNDFTNEVVSWQWFRESGDTQEDRDSDAIWSQGKTERIIHLTAADFTPNIHSRSIVFVCQAIVQNQKLIAKTNIG
ncbi:hypothetical protein [Myroides fluvii]|uniref:hypothetical protein n=1 Tax=Myroides fluvii TaxID=2572594 RepID=UPI001E4A4F27|nr:hypothetical protein [Myroides fluvii]